MRNLTVTQLNNQLSSFTQTHISLPHSRQPSKRIFHETDHFDLTLTHYFVNIYLRVNLKSTHIQRWGFKSSDTFCMSNLTLFGLIDLKLKVLWSFETTITIYRSISGFGGLGVACWPLVPKFAGSNPAEAVGFLRGEKNPQPAFLRRGSRHLGKITGQHSRPQSPLPQLGSLTSWRTCRNLVVKSGNI